MPVWQHWRQRERKSRGYWTGSPQQKKPSASETRSLQLRLQSKTKNSSHSTSYAFSLFYVHSYHLTLHLTMHRSLRSIIFSPLQVFMEELKKKFPEVEHATKSCKHKSITKQQVSPSKRPFTSKPSRKQLFLGGKKLLLVYKNCRNELSELIPDSTSLFLHPERRSALKLQPAVPIPLEHLDPQTPELSQLVSQWQKLWLLAVARQKHLEQHQQALKEVIVHAAHCSHLSLFCKTLSKLHYLT